MTIAEKQRELALYRMRQAEESLDEARHLWASRKSTRSVMNRIYYAMFYSVLALLVFETYSSSTHKGVLSFFNQTFVRTGRVPRQHGRALNRAFELRQRGDYREFEEVPADQIEPLLEAASQFVREVQSSLVARGLI